MIKEDIEIPMKNGAADAVLYRAGGEHKIRYSAP